MARALRSEADRTYRWADFIELPDDDKRELVDGRLVEIDVPTAIHEWIVSVFIATLYAWARARDSGLVLASGYKVRVRDDRGVMPDVQFFRKERVASLGMKGLESGAPDLAIEVISPASRVFDRREKLDWYGSIGTPEYWIVDPDARSLERYARRDGALALVERLAGEEVFRPGAFPGLEIALAELWTLPGQS